VIADFAQMSLTINDSFITASQLEKWTSILSQNFHKTAPEREMERKDIILPTVARPCLEEV
jgi:hypothetical protein